MIRFLLGLALPLTLFAALGLVLPSDWWANRLDWWELLASLVGLPLAGAWLAAEVTARIRRPRLLDPRAAVGLRPALVGAAAGLLAVVSLTLAIAALPRLFPQPLTLILAPAIAVAIIIATLPRARPGSCLSCGYDLSHSPDRCPECGLARAAIRPISA